MFHEASVEGNLSPGSALRRQEVKKSAVKWMSTSQKKSSTLWLRLHALAPTSRPRPRENSSFIWIRVKLLNRVSLRDRRQEDCLNQTGTLKRLSAFI